MKKLYTLFVALIFAGNLIAQTPQSFKYQAVASDASGDVLADKVLTIESGIPAWKDTTGRSSGHYVGELYGGGIVFYVDHTGEHGLIASLDDLDGGSGVAWSNVTATEIEASAQSFYNGASNTMAIIGQAGHISSAAKDCDDYSNEGFTDWYLPASWELYELYNTARIISNILDNNGNGTTNGIQVSNSSPYGYYWSSTECPDNTAWHFRFRRGYSATMNKTKTYRVRAVRAF